MKLMLEELRVLMFGDKDGVCSASRRMPIFGGSKHFERLRKVSLMLKGNDGFDKHLQPISGPALTQATFLRTIEFPRVGPNCLPYPRNRCGIA